MKDTLFFHFLRIMTFPFSLMPFWMIHLIGKALGPFVYYILPKYRKRTLSNLALAIDLNLSPKQIRKIAKKSFQNLCIVILEYPKLARGKNLEKHIHCKNPEEAEKIYKSGKGIIFFCAHQANWETLFLEGTRRMKGIAIGKPINNKHLYHWILDMRSQFGGKIVEAKKALREGLRALNDGIFLGILGDQGMPTSDFSYPFFGRKAWTTTAPALLAIKTNSPVIFAQTRREFGKYIITYSDPIYPNLQNKTSDEVERLTNILLTLLEKSIVKRPHEWLWQHNRYKQLTPRLIYRKYRFDSILIILPKEASSFEKISPLIPLLLKIYQGSFITILVSDTYKEIFSLDACEIKTFSSYKETLLDDYRFKLVFNFTPFSKIHRYYLRRAAFKVLSTKYFQRKGKSNLYDLLKTTLCRKKQI